MKILSTIIISFILFGFLFVQCDRDRRMRSHQMNGQQMEQLMQNPEVRQKIMQRMADNPEMRREMMNHMRSGMTQLDQESMMANMISMMEDPEHRQQMVSHMQKMQSMLEQEEFDPAEMKRMMQESDMMQIHMQCMQMMHRSNSMPPHN